MFKLGEKMVVYGTGTSLDGTVVKICGASAIIGDMVFYIIEYENIYRQLEFGECSHGALPNCCLTPLSIENVINSI